MNMIKGAIKKIVKLFGFTISKARMVDNPEQQITRRNFFDLYFSKVDPATFFFIEMGGNDGKTNDPIYPYVTKYKLSGIIIEPQEDVFKLLQDTYKDYPNVKCINAAISNETGRQTFYTAKESIKNKDNYSRITGIASFNKDILRRTIKNKLPANVSVDDYIQETKVKTISLTDLLNEHKIRKVNMIQTDCEGFDYEIIKMIDFNKISPDIINFESEHLSESDLEECQNLLTTHEYRWFRFGGDTCAYKV